MNLFAVTIGGGSRWRRFRLCADWEPRANPRLITRSVVPQTFRVLNLKLLGLLKQPYKQKLPNDVRIPIVRVSFADSCRWWRGAVAVSGCGLQITTVHSSGQIHSSLYSMNLSLDWRTFGVQNTSRHFHAFPPNTCRSSARQPVGPYLR